MNMKIELMIRFSIKIVKHKDTITIHEKSTRQETTKKRKNNFKTI